MKATIEECNCKSIEINENGISYLFFIIIDIELFNIEGAIVHIPVIINKKISI